MVRVSFDGGHTGDPERDLAYEREHVRRGLFIMTNRSLLMWLQESS